MWLLVLLFSVCVSCSFKWNRERYRNTVGNIETSFICNTRSCVLLYALLITTTIFMVQNGNKNNSSRTINQQIFSFSSTNVQYYAYTSIAHKGNSNEDNYWWKITAIIRQNKTRIGKEKNNKGYKGNTCNEGKQRHSEARSTIIIIIKTYIHNPNYLFLPLPMCPVAWTIYNLSETSDILSNTAWSKRI